jgi:hypothetical protein
MEQMILPRLSGPPHAGLPPSAISVAGLCRDRTHPARRFTAGSAICLAYEEVVVIAENSVVFRPHRQNVIHRHQAEQYHVFARANSPDRFWTVAPQSVA